MIASKNPNQQPRGVSAPESFRIFPDGHGHWCARKRNGMVAGTFFNRDDAIRLRAMKASIGRCRSRASFELTRCFYDSCRRRDEPTARADVVHRAALCHPAPTRLRRLLLVG